MEIHVQAALQHAFRALLQQTAPNAQWAISNQELSAHSATLPALLVPQIVLTASLALLDSTLTRPLANPATTTVRHV